MKKKEILYSAISGISEDKAADAYEYTNYNRKKAVFQNIMKGVGIAAIVCSFIVASLILQAVSGPKTLPDDANAAATAMETSSDADTEANVISDVTVKETENVTTAESITELYGPNGEKLCCIIRTIEELRKTAPVKDFLPTNLPEDMQYCYSQILFPGEYKSDEITYSIDNERACVFLRNIDNLDGRGYTELDIMMHKADLLASLTPAEEISISTAERSVFYESHGEDNPTLPGKSVSIAFAADGWEIVFDLKRWSGYDCL